MSSLLDRFLIDITDHDDQAVAFALYPVNFHLRQNLSCI